MNETQLQASAIAHQAPYTEQGLTFTRRFSTEGASPYNDVQWEKRTASITDTKGNTIFEQKDVEVPVDWSMTATNIVASKYLHGQIGTAERETGVRQLVGRVAETIRDWGIAGGYFASGLDAEIFHDELAHMLLTQKVAFNSPVWFNVGGDGRRDVRSDRLSQSAVLGLLYQFGRRFAGFDSDAGQDRRHAVQVGLGHGNEPVDDSRVEGNALRRRRGFGAVELHARVRCVRGRDQVGRQDAARGQDGDPECGPPGHHGLHRLQGQGRSQGFHADQGRIRRVGTGFGGLFLDLLPERKQLGAGERRVHACI